MKQEENIVSIAEDSSDSAAKIHLHGACIVSYSVKGREYIFVSKKAITDGSRAIRGGIPVVFPIFGPPQDPTRNTMPQHGFARVNRWKLLEKKESSATFGLGLSDNDAVRTSTDVSWAESGRGENNPWAVGSKLSCKLYLTVQLSGGKLLTTLRVVNAGVDSFSFQTLFHTYYRVANGAALNSKQCYIRGLQGYSVVDKVGDKSEGGLGPEPVVVEAELDRVYTPPSGKTDLKLVVGVGNNEKLELSAVATVAGEPVPTSCVAWNPHVEKSKRMSASDFGAEEYHDMICVEPGILEIQELDGGHEGSFHQVVRIIDS